MIIDKIANKKKLWNQNSQKLFNPKYRKRLHTNPGLIPKIPPKEHALNTIHSMHFISPL